MCVAQQNALAILSCQPKKLPMYPKVGVVASLFLNLLKTNFLVENEIKRKQQPQSLFMFRYGEIHKASPLSLSFSLILAVEIFSS